MKTQSTKKLPNTQKILTQIKQSPMTFDYSSNHNQYVDTALINACIAVLNPYIDQVVNRESIQRLKATIAMKRQRNSTASEYNRSLESNILFELVKYDRLIKLFNIVVEYNSNITQLDYDGFISLLQEDSHREVENRERLASRNQAVKNLLSQYAMRDTESREYDYIYSFLKYDLLSNAIQDVINGKLEIGYGNLVPTHDFFGRFTAKDIIATMDARIMMMVGMNLSTLY